MSCCRDMVTPIEASSCCTPHDTVAQAAQAMRDSGCGSAPVVKDTEHLKLIGVVTSVTGIAAWRLMTGARRKLREYRATSLPVVNKAGCCCGTVSVHGLEKP